jgi:hypothetical protein
MPLREDDVAPRTGVHDKRAQIRAGGFVLAVAATLAVFLTDNPQILKLAVVGVAWAFVLATFAAAARSTERAAARAREKELRRAYVYELDREVAARRKYELELENELRRESEESMRADLDALRDDLAGLTELRTDLAGLSSLRDEVARLTALRDDIAALTSLRQEIGQLSELRVDMGRLRQELSEQLSSEMLIERIVMRTQASRLGSEQHDGPGRTIDVRWTDDAPPRELTGGWPAVRLDEPLETRQFDQVRVERGAVRPPVPPAPAAGQPLPASRPVPSPSSRPVPSPSWRPSWESEPERPRSWETPATASWEAASTPSWHAPETASWETLATPSWQAPGEPPSAAAAPARDAAEDTPLWSSIAADTAGTPRPGGVEEPPPTAAFPMAPSSGGPRPGAVPPTTANPVVPPPVSPPEPVPSPLEWLAARALIDAEPAPARTEEPPRRRRGDEALADPAVALTTQRPAVPANPPIRVDDRGGYRVAVREEQPAERPGQEKRLEDILAENGVRPATGGRRRRRYRDDDESDDILARVLRNG